MEDKNSFSLEQLYKKVSSVLKDNLSLFQGLTITNVSIDKKLTPHPKWQYSFYTGTTKSDNKNYGVQLKISNNIINNHHAKSGADAQHNASYDIVIDSLAVSAFGAITVTAKAINETGVSERELLKRRLEKFCREHGYLERDKKPLPRMVTSILALTSKYSEIHDDLLSNINIDHEKVVVVNCQTSKEISEQIKRADSSRFNLVVLYRGGREDEAMNMFSSEDIIESIAKSDIPVCAALGHDADIPFIYTVSDQTYSTPSAFGKAITAHNSLVKKELDDTIIGIKNTLETLVDRLHTQYLQSSENIEATSIRLYEKVISKIAGLLVDSKNSAEVIRKRIDNHYIQTGESVEATSVRLYEKVVSKVDKLILDSLNSVDMIANKMNNELVLSFNEIENSTNSIYRAKAELVVSNGRTITHHTQTLYKAKMTYISELNSDTKTYFEQIKSQSKHREMLDKEKSDKRKLYIVATVVIVVLVIVILALVFS